MTAFPQDSLSQSVSQSESGSVDQDCPKDSAPTPRLFHFSLSRRHLCPEKRFKQPDTYPLASEILVAIGFKGRIDKLSEPLPWSLNYPIDPICVNGREIDRLTLKHFSHEPGFAPEGRTLLVYDINQFHDDYEAWAAMDPATYQAEKQRIGEEVIAATEARFPAMRGRLSLLDVATPRTYERYCNAIMRLCQRQKKDFIHALSG